MAKIRPFELYTQDYERWFEKNRPLYISEVQLLKNLIKEITFKKALEVGIGSGRFAVPLGVKYGVDPSLKMLKLAQKRGLKVAKGIAERLPVKTAAVDLVLMVTTICFVDDPIQTLREVARILIPGGYFLIGFVDKNSLLGKLYEKKKTKSRFYKEATFFSTNEVISLVEENSPLRLIKAGQTIFGIENKVYPPKEGFGEGSFVGLLFKRYKT